MCPPAPFRRRAYPFAIASVLVSSLITPVGADQVIPDDLIVQSSGAFGFDAADGESFGVDTIRLKENNLRIHFDDTSTTAGYTANDWRLIANDQASGGANYFAIEDSTAGHMPFRVDAGAPADAFRLTSIGRVGIGTSTPGLQMEIHHSNTPAMRLAQNNSIGYTAQTWDVGGNEANFFIRDVTGGSKLSFRIRPGAPTSSIDIAADGDVGIGTASPTAKLHVAGNALVTGTLEIGSSRAIKEGIKDLSLKDARETLVALKPVHFKYKNETEQQLGFIAEDVPDLVATDSRKSLVPMDFVAVLTKVVQQHDDRVKKLEEAVNARDKAIEALTVRLEALERGATARGAATAMSAEEREARHALRRDPAGASASAAVTAPETPQEGSLEVLDNGR
jgi:hypothetical protein